MDHQALSHGELERLADLANASLPLWDVPPDAAARLINISENATYLVEGAGGHRSVLRLHRDGYHSERAIECELAWMDALTHDGCVEVPRAIPGRDGRPVQTAAGPDGSTRFMVMFAFVPGTQPDESHDLVGPFEALGEMAARMHQHAIHWRRPEPFERLTWDVDAVFGADATWGNWRDAPHLDASARSVLERAETKVRARLAAFGRGPERYGLIHADMRLANLLIDGGTTRLIDFDDCGFGWFLYDFAAGISFMEDSPVVPALREAWVAGYRRVRPLSDADEREIDTFVMLRRMALLAWIGSHSAVPEAAALAPDFARNSADLAETYLARSR